MSVFRCKMCGGNITVADGQTVCECEHCGAKQTVPVFDNRKRKYTILIACVISVAICLIAAVCIKLHLSHSQSGNTTTASVTKETTETEVTEKTEETTDESTAETTSETTTESTTEKKPVFECNTERVWLSEYGKCFFDKITLSGTFKGINRINADLNTFYNEIEDDAFVIEEDPNNPGYDIDGTDLTWFSYWYELKDKWHDDNYFSIMYDYYINAGGTGDWGKIGRTYDLITGKKLTLEEFTNKSRSEIVPILKKYISSYIEESHTRYSSETIPEDADKLLNDSSYEVKYSVDEDCIYLLFNKYEISCGSDGDFAIPIPKSELLK